MLQQIDDINEDRETTKETARDSIVTLQIIAIQTDSKSIEIAKIIPRSSFSERCRTHRFWLIRAIYQVFRSVWMVVMVVGGVIEWVIAMLFI